MTLSNKKLNAILIAILAVLHIFTAFYHEVNWDEFFRLGRVYEWQRGELTAPFESGYIYGFLWLDLISKNEVVQIIGARLIMAALLFYSAFCIQKILDIYFTRLVSQIAIIGFLGFSFILATGTSFRIDPIIVALMLTAIWMILSPTNSRRYLLAGICIGVAGFLSLKSVFYVPSIGLLLLWQVFRSDDPFGTFKLTIFTGLTSIGAFALLIFLHKLTLPQPDNVANFMTYAGRNSLFKYGIFPRSRIFLLSVFYNPFYWVVIIIGLVQITKIFGHQHAREKIIIASILSVPLVSLLFYAHAYNYYYTFLLAPLSFLMALGIERISKMTPKLIWVLPVLLAGFAFSNLKFILPYPNDYQHHVLEQVHKIFPEPVHYIDRCSMVSTYPKSGLFMSYIQMDEYHEAADPVMVSVIRDKQPKFVLANLPGLDIDLFGQKDLDRTLMAEDSVALQRNYIHHWGPIYVAGKRLPFEPDLVKLDIIIPGKYTIETDHDIIINETTYSDREIIELRQGPLEITKKEKSKTVLRWGDNLLVPNVSKSDRPLFRR